MALDTPNLQQKSLPLDISIVYCQMSYKPKTATSQNDKRPKKSNQNGDELKWHVIDMLLQYDV